MSRSMGKGASATEERGCGRVRHIAMLGSGHGMCSMWGREAFQKSLNLFQLQTNYYWDA